MRILSTLFKIGPKREFTQFGTKGKIKLNSWDNNIKWFVFVSRGLIAYFVIVWLSIFCPTRTKLNPTTKKKASPRLRNFHLVSVEILQRNNLAEYKNQQEIYLILHLQSTLYSWNFYLVSFEILTSQKIV